MIRSAAFILLVAAGSFALPARSSAQDANAPEACRARSSADAESGWEAYGAGDMAEARARFEAALALCDQDDYARTGLGYVALREGRESEAVALWTRVVRSDPDDVDALTGLGLAAVRAGDLTAVAARFGRVLEIVPNHPTALHRLAMLDAWDARYDRSLERFDRLLDVAPDLLDARVDRARVLAWSGDTTGALRALDAVLEESPAYLPALEARAQFRAWAGSYEESAAGYDALLSIAPDNRDARMQQAAVLRLASDLDASLSAFDAVLARDPDDVEARLGRAAALAYSGRLEEAIAEYDRVLARDPGHRAALHGMGRTLGWAGRLVGAERALRGAVQSDPGDVTALSLLSQNLRWQGRNAAALRTLERAAALDPANGDVREQLRGLELVLGSSARPTVAFESDSDGNSMRTMAIAATWHPSPRLNVRTDAYEKALDQGALARSAYGVNLTGSLQIEPGWRVHAGVGGSTVRGAEGANRAAAAFGVTTPGRYPFGGAISFNTAGLDATAALAARDVRMSELTLNGRWEPARRWRLDGSVARARFAGSETNHRTSGFLSLSRDVVGGLTLGAAARAFGFEKDLTDGYFDPEFFTIAELPLRWLGGDGPWSFLAEVAPGAQRITEAGTARAGGTVRLSGRIAYDLGPGREVSLAAGYSSAGLQSFATGAADYHYRALILGAGWSFR